MTALTSLFAGVIRAAIQEILSTSSRLVSIVDHQHRNHSVCRHTTTILGRRRTAGRLWSLP